MKILSDSIVKLCVNAHRNYTIFLAVGVATRIRQNCNQPDTSYRGTDIAVAYFRNKTAFLSEYPWWSECRGRRTSLLVVDASTRMSLYCPLSNRLPAILLKRKTRILSCFRRMQYRQWNEDELEFKDEIE